MSIVEFDGPPSWSERANRGEYKMPVGRGGGGGHSRRQIINPISSTQTLRRLLIVCFHTPGFVQVMENLESHGILQFHFPGLESPEI